MRHSKLVGAVSNPDLSGSRSRSEDSDPDTSPIHRDEDARMPMNRHKSEESGQAVSTYHGPYAVRLKTAPTGPGAKVFLYF